MDLVVKCCGIQLASKCVCYVESLLHLFMFSDLAVSLWHYFRVVIAIGRQLSHSLLAR